MPYRTKSRERERRRELRRILKEDYPELYKKKLEKCRIAQKKLTSIPGKRSEYQNRHIEKIGIEEWRRRQGERMRKRHKDPWQKTYYSIHCRLRRAKHLDVWGNKYRCYVGIEMHMTPNNLKMLWERDNAAQMVKPSIDRKDPKGHYSVENCQYIEMRDNRAKVVIKK